MQLQLINDLLTEATRDDYLKSFQILTGAGNQGKFKSEKQAKFLLDQCEKGNDGKYYFHITQTLRFGEHGGASAKVNWSVICDEQGVDEIQKSTGAKPTPVTTFKRGSQESLDRDTKKAEQKARGHQEHIAYYKQAYDEAVAEEKASNDRYADVVEKVKNGITNGVIDQDTADELLKDQLGFNNERLAGIALRKQYAIDELKKIGVTDLE